MLALPAPITVDPAARTVTVEAGATWAEVDAATQRHGLAVTGARLSGSPVALGGDGWLVRAMGLTS
ncbi:MAG: FAD-dependent oxidoreductase, partial [Actinomycetota bacterium]|nr:FAD-dependent oxidoreductase [Actinomycetota bacterium]